MKFYLHQLSGWFLCNQKSKMYLLFFLPELKTPLTEHKSVIDIV